MDRLPIRRALLSVTHKDGLAEFARFLHDRGVELVSTGGTMKFLKEQGLPVTAVSDVTGFPEILGGRVKTLHPYIHAGILADMTNPEHAKQLEEFGIKPFDLVVVNLYPFADTVRSGANEADTIEKIDIGGPSMVRGAAKNHATVAIVTDPADYALVASRVADGTGFSLDERKWLAAKAFAHTAAYDATINDEAMALEVSRTLENIVGEGNVILTNKPFMGSEDFGCFTQHVPGVLFWLGIGTGEDDKPLHNPYFKMDLQALPVGTACHVQNALHFLK